jgi:Tfp pilus assembly protein PilN
VSDSGPGPYCSDGNHCYQRERITELEAKLKAAELDAHTKDAFYGEKFAAQEIKLKAAEEWKAEAMALLETVLVTVDEGFRATTIDLAPEWTAQRADLRRRINPPGNALLAQEGGE